MLLLTSPGPLRCCQEAATLPLHPPKLDINAAPSAIFLAIRVTSSSGSPLLDVRSHLQLAAAHWDTRQRPFIIKVDPFEPH